MTGEMRSMAFPDRAGPMRDTLVSTYFRKRRRAEIAHEKGRPHEERPFSFRKELNNFTVTPA